MKARQTAAKHAPRSRFAEPRTSTPPTGCWTSPTSRSISTWISSKRPSRGSVRHVVRVVPDDLPSFTLDAVALAIESVSADGSPVPFVARRPQDRGPAAHAVAPRRVARPRDRVPGTPRARDVVHRAGRGLSREAAPGVDAGTGRGRPILVPVRRLPEPEGDDGDPRRGCRRGSRRSRTAGWSRATDRGASDRVPLGAGGPARRPTSSSLVVGRFDVVEDRAGEIALRYFVPTGAAATRSARSAARRR